MSVPLAQAEHGRVSQPWKYGSPAVTHAKSARQPQEEGWRGAFDRPEPRGRTTQGHAVFVCLWRGTASERRLSAAAEKKLNWRDCDWAFCYYVSCASSCLESSHVVKPTRGFRQVLEACRTGSFLSTRSLDILYLALAISDSDTPSLSIDLASYSSTKMDRFTSTRGFIDQPDLYQPHSSSSSSRTPETSPSVLDASSDSSSSSPETMMPYQHPWDVESIDGLPRLMGNGNGSEW